jgi:replicative DNA helicase
LGEILAEANGKAAAPFAALPSTDGHGDAWEGEARIPVPASLKKEPLPGGFIYRPMSSAELDSSDFRPEWAIRGISILRQPGAIVGGSKAMKTTLGIDAAISLGSASQFLGCFEVAIPRRVLFLSGESGEYVIQETARRICRSRGLQLADLTVKWQCQLPKLAMDDELSTLKIGMEGDGIEVMFLDPLYLSLLAGSQRIEASNMFEMGPLLYKIGRMCADIGVTPWFLHHTNRTGARKNEPLELSDIAYSGIPEFARQWWLLSRRQPYNPGSGQHELFMSVGGSVGHGGLWELDIDEGKLAEDFTGRKWEVEVTGATLAKKDAAKEKEQQKTAQQQEDELKLAAVIDRQHADGGATLTRIRNGCGLSRPRADGALERLLLAKLFKKTPGTIKRSDGKEKPAELYVRNESVAVCVTQTANTVSQTDSVCVGAPPT